MCDICRNDRVKYKQLLNEIGEDYCQSEKYCIFKEFLLSLHPSRRLLV